MAAPGEVIGFHDDEVFMRRPMLTASLLALVLFSGSTPAVAAGALDTFDVDFRVYCKPKADGSRCGVWKDDAALTEELRRWLLGTNVKWEPIGV